MNRIAIGIFMICLVLTLNCGPAWSQATAQISGTVRDQSGAVLPGVEVTATQTDTGIARSTVTNETGFYALPNLPLGPYRLEGALAGFRTFVQTGITLQVNSNPVINVTLEVGQVTEQIEVQANATLVETRSTGIGVVIESQRINELPLNGRQVSQFITLSGLAVQTATSPGYSMNTGVRVAVAGGMDFGVQYSLDGAPHINTLDGTSMPLPFPDALQEFRLVTSTQDASNGMRGAAALNSVTKSGTNAFHGSLFEFVRNNKFNGRDVFATRNDGLKRNLFGGTIGGPIKKDKAFFFAGYQGTITRQTPANETFFVPTPAMLAGDFTTFASPACQGGRQINLVAGFVGNRIDPSRFSPAALKISSFLPKPIDQCGRVLTGNPFSEDQLQIPVRIDYQHSDKQTFFGRYMLTTIEQKVPYELASHDILTTSAPGSDDRAQSVTIGHTYLFSPQIVNSLRLSGNRVDAHKLGAEFFGPQDVGINAYSYVPKYVTVRVTGGFNLGAGNFTSNVFAYISNFGVNDDLSIVRGSHQFSFGGHAVRSLLWHSSNAWSIGSYTLTGQVAGHGLADFLLGNVAQLRQANPNPENITQNFFGLYAQDTWKATPKLTFNYGVRWEPFFPMQFRHGDLYNFNLQKFYSGQRSSVIRNAPPGFTYPGDPGFYGKAGIQTRWTTFDPRAGLAWDPFGDGRTAIRASAGIAHDYMKQDLHENTSSVSPFRLTVIDFNLNLDNPWRNYPGGNPFPYTYNANNPAFAPYGSYLPVPPDMKTTTQYSWNFGVQRQVTSNWFASATYVGSQVAHVWSALELNPAQFLGLGPCTLQTPNGSVSYPVCSTSGNINQRRILNLANPNVSLGYITQYDDGGTQNYNGLLLNTRLNVGQNLNFNANYTWSRCVGLAYIGLLNPGANYIHQAYQNNGPVNRNLDVGDCVQDRRQIMNVTMVTKTPTFSNNIVRALASDWSFGTVVQARSGAPLSVIIGSDVALNGFQGNTGAQRPNQILGSPYGDRSTLTSYLNASAFSTPALGTYSALGVSTVVGPSFWQWDESISRQFQIREGQRLEVRAEAFNVTNSFRRGNPGTTLGSLNTFGRILSSVGGPRVMQFAVKYVF